MESLNVNNGKKKLTMMINLSIFTNLADSFANLSYSSTSPNKSPRNFKNTSSVVGLSIVAAMSQLTADSSSNNQENYYSISRPVHIVISPSAANYNSNKNQKKKKKPAAGVVINITDHDDELQAVVDEELSESNYTCVISHLGNDLVHKRVFFDHHDDHDDDDEIGKFSVFFASSPPVKVGFELKREFWSRDYFLSSCFLCNKNLHGLDIFMYRGEKAFCSTECRDKQIRSDDVKDNCGSEARKQLDYSVSPCSGPPPPPPISAGVSVA